MARFYTILSFYLVAALGCSGPANQYGATVTGTVVIDGELAESGTVVFHPVEEGIPAIGRIHKDGSYSLRTGQGDLQEADGGTVIPGKYVVTVSITEPSGEDSQIAEQGPLRPGRSLVAAKYSSFETSDLERTIEPGPQVIVLKLTKDDPASVDDSSKLKEEQTATDSSSQKTSNGSKVSEATQSGLAPSSSDKPQRKQPSRDGAGSRTSQNEAYAESSEQ